MLRLRSLLPLPFRGLGDPRFFGDRERERFFDGERFLDGERFFDGERFRFGDGLPRRFGVGDRRRFGVGERRDFRCGVGDRLGDRRLLRDRLTESNFGGSTISHSAA